MKYRVEKHNEFIQKHNIMGIESFDCNGIKITRNSVMDIIYLSNWQKLNHSHRLKSIIWMFEILVEEYELNDYLKALLFIPKKGFETAFANYDKEEKVIFLNPNYIETNSLFIIWNLFHEIRHAIQYKNQDLISQGYIPMDDFYRSFRYYFTYDGTAYLFNNDEEFQYKIKQDEDFCIELYLRNPMEMDANKFAYKEMENIIRKNIGIFGDDNINLMDLEKNKQIFFPNFKLITDDIEEYIIKLCQALAELAYQNSMGIIDNHIFRQKEMEIYWAINQVLEKNNKVKLSFDLEELLLVGN
ncbi:hypothetical protein EDD65_11264 [Keratinibaculum paraultunense]|uniref:Uncharacterized protein n=1 Tax=Keratinibaculum paraultunense TaxID=1278232 RepID=A0A4R3KRU9_9FIRM|nr:hypothetical protein [Keratinibaculum paraultunense]QQY79682.1 hypothetical protein JL105_10960 [Keratinibaculum paraultunense]TCS87106.1 hypothetical protein EDD65_11264 [Keratinibaculum paraultunense]